MPSESVLSATTMYAGMDVRRMDKLDLLVAGEFTARYALAESSQGKPSAAAALRIDFLIIGQELERRAIAAAPSV